MKTYTFMEGVEQDWMQMDGDNYSYECVGRDFYLATEVEAHLAALQAQHAEALAEMRNPRPLSEWIEEDGPVLWWHFPIQEPPYCGTPLDDDWIGHEYSEIAYYTHWTRIPIPSDPQA